MSTREAVKLYGRFIDSNGVTHTILMDVEDTAPEEESAGYWTLDTVQDAISAINGGQPATWEGHPSKYAIAFTPKAAFALAQYLQGYLDLHRKLASDARIVE